MALSMATGRRVNPRNLERLVGDAVATLGDLGSPGDDLEQMLDSLPIPTTDAASRSSRCGELRAGSGVCRPTTAACSARPASTHGD